MEISKEFGQKVSLSLVATALLSSVALADNQSLETVEIWETQVTSSSLNMGSGTIETKQADHLSDLLRDLPGVEIGRAHV